MYAIIRTGGKQYRVAVGDVIEVEKLAQKDGKEVSFGEVLAVGEGDEVEFGRPLVAKAKVTGEVLGQIKGEKVLVFKHKKRKNYRRTVGHRQLLTRIRIKSITAH